MNPPNLYPYRSPTSSSPSSQEDDNYFDDEFDRAIQLAEPHRYWYELAGETIDSIKDEWEQLAEAKNFDEFEKLLVNAAKWFSNGQIDATAAQITQMIDFVIKNPDILQKVFTTSEEPDLQIINESGQKAILADLLSKTSEFNNIHFFYWHGLTRKTSYELSAALPQFLDTNPHADLFSELLFQLYQIPALQGPGHASNVVQVIEYVILENPNILHCIFYREDETNPFDGKNPLKIFKSIMLKVDLKYCTENSVDFQPSYDLGNEFIILDHWCERQNLPTWTFIDGWRKLKAQKNFNEFHSLLTTLFLLKQEHAVHPSKVIKLIQMIFKDPEPFHYYYDTYKLMDGSDYLCSNTLGVFQGLLNEIESWADPENIHITWHKKAGLSTEELDTQWEKLTGIPDFDEFAEMLRRLGEKELANKVDPTHVVKVIQAVIESDDAFVKFIFSYSQTAGADCHERPLNLFNQIRGFVQFEALRKSNADPMILLEFAKGKVRQDLLAYAATKVYEKQWNEQRSYGYHGDNTAFDDKEPLEYHVALCQELSSTLNLPMPVNSLFALGVAKLTEEDKTLATDFVNARMEEDLTGKLMEQEIWYQFLEQQCEPEITSIKKQLDIQLEEHENAYAAKYKNYYLDPAFLNESENIKAQHQHKIDELLKKETRELKAKAIKNSSTDDDFGSNDELIFDDGELFADFGAAVDGDNPWVVPFSIDDPNHAPINNDGPTFDVAELLADLDAGDDSQHE